MLDPEYAKLLPTTPENVAMQHQTDWAFWHENYESLNERWKEWTLE
jgi:putative spermidine/putrescine transport system substrate-binding protein